MSLSLRSDDPEQPPRLIARRFIDNISFLLPQTFDVIRRGDGDGLEEVFTKTRAIRRGVIDANQA